MWVIQKLSTQGFNSQISLALFMGADSLKFISLYLMDGKAKMQTIILKDFARSVYKHAFSFCPLFLALTAAHSEFAILFFYCLCIAVNFDLL